MNWSSGDQQIGGRLEGPHAAGGGQTIDGRPISGLHRLERLTHHLLVDHLNIAGVRSRATGDGGQIQPRIPPNRIAAAASTPKITATVNTFERTVFMSWTQYDTRKKCR